MAKEVVKEYTCPRKNTGKWKRDPRKYNLKVVKLTCLSEETYEKVERYAYSHDCSISKAIRDMVILGLKEIDENADLQGVRGDNR